MKKVLTTKQTLDLLQILNVRFAKNKNRHKDLEWPIVEARLKSNSAKLWSLNEMEKTAGEPDVIGYDKKTNEFIFYDCSEESPAFRRSICYDQAALASRKEHNPRNSALNMAAEMGIEILTEDQYRELQHMGSFDLKTSSWVKTPSEIRNLGGAIFCGKSDITKSTLLIKLFSDGHASNLPFISNGGLCCFVSARSSSTDLAGDRIYFLFRIEGRVASFPQGRLRQTLRGIELKNDRTVLDVSKLPAGVYLLQLYSHEKLWVVKRVVKE